MPFVRGFGGTEEDFPLYVRRARDRDRSWMLQGLCAPHNRPRDVPHVAWVVPYGETLQVNGHRYHGAVMESKAMPLCRVCPQQWSCTRWAIEVDEPTGTWGIPYKLLHWLKRQPDSLMIVDTAAASSTPVEVHVLSVKSRRV